MSKRIFIFSTMSADVNYRVFGQTAGDVPVAVGYITIKGGANVQDARLFMPAGVSTSVTTEQLEQLEASPVFRKHVEGGFITVSNVDADPEAAASDMTSRDASATLTENDYVNEDVTPVVNEAPTKRARRG